MPDLELAERAILYRSCLDAYFDYLNMPVPNEPHIERRWLRLEGMLGDYAPPNSTLLFREMITALAATVAGAGISTDPEKDPEEHRRQYLKWLRPSARSVWVRLRTFSRMTFLTGAARFLVRRADVMGVEQR